MAKTPIRDRKTEETRTRIAETGLKLFVSQGYAETTIDVLTVATYTQSPTDHSWLFLEIADQDYLDAPRPSVSP